MKRFSDKTHDKNKKLDQPAFNRARLKAEKLIDSKVLEQLIRVQVDAGCSSGPIPTFASACSTLASKCRNQRTTSNIMNLVELLNLTFEQEFAANGT